MTQYSSLASVRATRERLAELGLSTKKNLGQHFLIDDGVVGKILRLAALEPQSTVVEVGPGIGTLTEALLESGAELTSVEVDKSLWSGLSEHYPQLALICGDALAQESIKRLQELKPDVLVANLPYSVAATIILEYFEVLPSLSCATVMVQREVAERIAAKPGTKEYGAYTVKLGLRAEVAGDFKVSRQSFYPPPRVDSSVIRLERRKDYCELGVKDLPVAELDSLLAHASMLADAAFFQRRKTIRNSMQSYFSAHNLDPASVDALLDKASISPKVRGEALGFDDYIKLALAGSPLLV